MKAVGTHTVRPIVVQQNTTKRTPDFGVIKCAKSGVVLHQGQIQYIRGVAKKKYNTAAF